jgi:hypothetical protein
MILRKDDANGALLLSLHERQDDQG